MIAASQMWQKKKKGPTLIFMYEQVKKDVTRRISSLPRCQDKFMINQCSLLPTIVRKRTTYIIMTIAKIRMLNRDHACNIKKRSVCILCKWMFPFCTRSMSIHFGKEKGKNRFSTKMTPFLNFQDKWKSMSTLETHSQPTFCPHPITTSCPSCYIKQS